MNRCSHTSYCPVTDHLDSNGLCVSHCPIGVRVQREMTHLASIDKLTVDAIYRLFADEDEHWVVAHNCEPQKKTHKGNGAYQGAFAFTLTKSPKDDLTEEDMIKAVRKLMAQKSCPLKKYAWYLEYGDPTLRAHPHIHGMYETEKGGRIEAKHFKRAWPVWDENVAQGSGFRGGYHRAVRSDEGYMDYIREDGGLHDEFGIE